MYYSPDARWRACNAADCPTANVDWGDDSLTYTLALRASFSKGGGLRSRLEALAATAPVVPPPCQQVLGCTGWSDVPEWDSIALSDEYALTRDPVALTKAEEAFAYVRDSRVYELGACPAIPYQQAGGEIDHLKTLETLANWVKAALLLYRTTRDRAYLRSAVIGYAAARKYFLDSRLPLYTVFVFDDGRRCWQVPHRFFASVNGDMIWSGTVLYHDTGRRRYLAQAIATATAVEQKLSDGRGVFVDLQAENDVVEPLIEGMMALAREGQRSAREWLLVNAAAALGARTPDGSFGRFFDGPPPATIVTAWQTNGGLAIEIAAAALAPRTTVSAPPGWARATYVRRHIGALPATIRFRGSGIALTGTIGEHCCPSGHARVLVDGRETPDRTGIWPNTSAPLDGIPDATLFAWRWRKPGVHTVTLLPGIWNLKEGGSFLAASGYEVLRH